MLSVEKQIAQEKLVCPISHHPLVQDGDRLHTADGRHYYPFIDGVPIMLPEDQQTAYLAESGGDMASEYAQVSRPSPLGKLINWVIGKDYRSEASRKAFEAAIGSQPEDALCLAVGGGPHHVHPKLVNLNIGAFANVHVVGDAYTLPYADGSLDAIHCEAVLEHLEYPEAAVAEMFRAARVGGQVFAATPFLQHFHAYPNHFQNFTLIGHQRLFERAGFEVVSAGVCVGPTYAVSGLNYRYVAEYTPTRLLRWLLSGLVAVWALSLRPLDTKLNWHPGAHLLASTTYVHLVKTSKGHESAIASSPLRIEGV